VVLELAEPFTADPDFEYGETVTIKKDGVKWFVGRVVITPRSAGGGRERLGYELAGPWWYLDNLTFQQNWKSYDDSDALITVARSRVLLGMDDDGNAINTADQLDAILSYCIAAGAPFQIGTLPTGLLAWTQGFLDQTCSEVVRAILRWHPDCVTWFDYTTSPPTLHIDHRANLAATTISNDGSKLADIEIYDRADLVPPAVVIKYEKANSVDGSTYVSVQIDKFPLAATGGEFGALVTTVSLRGVTASYHKQRIRAETIPPDGSTGDTVENWWKEHVPWLKDYANANLAVGGHLIAFARRVAPPEAASEDQEVEDSTDPGDYPRELIFGTIEDWMQVKAERLIVSATIACNAAENEKVLKQFPDRVKIGGTAYPAVKVSVEITGTDAVTKLYKGLASYSPAEATPTGIAQHLYEALLEVHHEGRLTVAEAEVGETILHPGRVLNITDAERTEWGTMAALIQSVDEDIQSGRTRIAFGPPGHLAPQDYVELMRALRRSSPTWWTIESRTEAEPPQDEGSGGGDVVGGHQEPKTNTNTTPAVHHRHMWLVSDNGDGSIYLEPGYQFGQGDVIGEPQACSPSGGPNYSLSGTKELWVQLITDEYGIRQSVEGSWQDSGHAPEEQRHREPLTDSAADEGQTGEYWYHILTVVSGSPPTVTYHTTGAIWWFADRSAKNWPEYW
jgi:hypothetical protein